MLSIGKCWWRRGESNPRPSGHLVAFYTHSPQYRTKLWLLGTSPVMRSSHHHLSLHKMMSPCTEASSVIWRIDLPEDHQSIRSLPDGSGSEGKCVLVGIYRVTTIFGEIGSLSRSASPLHETPVETGRPQRYSVIILFCSSYCITRCCYGLAN